MKVVESSSELPPSPCRGVMAPSPSNLVTGMSYFFRFFWILGIFFLSRDSIYMRGDFHPS
ncbi:MAG TPA: hypothetical protein VIW22_01170 [Nitrososphaerales archaeon]